jgi:hypothetical protein
MIKKFIAKESKRYSDNSAWRSIREGVKDKICADCYNKLNKYYSTKEDESTDNKSYDNL